MTAECYPVAQIPGTSALFAAFCEPVRTVGSAIARWYPAMPFGDGWAGAAPEFEEEHRERLAAALAEQVRRLGGGEVALGNVEAIRRGAAVVVTGQQVGLFGGPLLTLLKAATAIRKAEDATRVSGRKHVPVFWLASEDHDLAEVDQAALLSKVELERFSVGITAEAPVPVGGLPLWRDVEGKAKVEAMLDRVSDLLGWTPECDWLRECYAAGETAPTLAGAFGRWIAGVFARFGLVVMDAAGRPFHQLGKGVLRAAIERADELERALIERSEELVRAGFHAQVMVGKGHSLLFLIDAETGARLPLRRTAEGGWKAGSRGYATAELLGILEAEPERISPNALLRPVFEDAILPTAAYVGGPAEVAYFAQAAVVYEAILGRVTPVLPRLSATLVTPAVGKLMAQFEVQAPQVWEERTAEELAVRLGARSMPVEAKRKLAAVGNAMDAELGALTAYMAEMSADLGRAAGVSASKMRYQMNRLRRLAARFELDRQTSLKKHATAMVLGLYPEEHLQERVVAGVQLLAQAGEGLVETLVAHAGLECPGHRVIFCEA